MAENTNTNNAELVQNEDRSNEVTRAPESYSVPPVDIYEEKEGLVVTADLPGVSQEQIKIQVDQNVLTIRADVAESNDNQELTYREYQLRSYYRQFKLGESIDQTKIQAKYENGVLTLGLPFAEESKPKQIQVNVA